MHEGMHLLMRLFPRIKVPNMTCKQNALRTAWLWLNKYNSFFGERLPAGPGLLI